MQSEHPAPMGNMQRQRLKYVWSLCSTLWYSWYLAVYHLDKSNHDWLFVVYGTLQWRAEQVHYTVDIVQDLIGGGVIVDVSLACGAWLHEFRFFLRQVYVGLDWPLSFMGVM